jgi:hypothetical protein
MASPSNDFYCLFFVLPLKDSTGNKKMQRINKNKFHRKTKKLAYKFPVVILTIVSTYKTQHKEKPK